MISSLDEARAANPDLAFALYAMQPGGDVTLEIHTPDGEYYTFQGPTEAAALAEAFPPEEAEPPASPEPTNNDIFD